MSWLSKLNSQMDGILNKDDKRNQHSSAPPTEQRGYDYAPQQQYGYPNQSPQTYQQPFGAPPAQQQYGAPQTTYCTHPYSSPPLQNQYTSPPPQYPYSTPPQQSGGLPPTPLLPPGWKALWDPEGSRWAYLEQWNNLVSWTFPISPPAGGAGAYDPTRGYGNAGGYGGQDTESYDQSNMSKPKDGSKKNMMMGAAAGVAVGAVGGMVIANALDSDDERHENGGEYSGAGYPPMEAPLPDKTASGSSVSSSDREEVEEAREEYEAAYEEAYD